MKNETIVELLKQAIFEIDSERIGSGIGILDNIIASLTDEHGTKKDTPNYFLIRTQDLLQLQLDVGKFMDCGYIPLGCPDIHYHSNQGGRCTFIQAMIKKEFK